MTGKYRDTLAGDLTPIQQSMTIDQEDYNPVMQLNRLMLGIVLEVYPSDTEKNRSAVQKEDRLGFMHMCSVLVIQDGSSAYLKLDNVMITPDGPSGVDDYQERLPRGSSQLMTGDEYNAPLHQIDPYSLDGDLCVVGFLGGQMDQPFVVRWWPHPANSLDPATSGAGLEGDTLKQHRRYFKRVNGVEKTITSTGDIVLSTALAGGKVQPGQKPAKGRLARSVDPEEGGSVRVYIKPSQSVEMTWDEQPSGISVRDSINPELPQPNPRQQEPQAEYKKENTFFYADKSEVEFSFPGNGTVTVGTNLVITAEGKLDVISEDVLKLDGTEIKHGAAAEEAAIKGDSFKSWLENFTVDSPFGPLKATKAYVDTLPDAAFSDKNLVE